MILKFCYKCKKKLSTDLFYKDRTSSDGYNSLCKSCSKIASHNYRIANREKLLVKSKLYRDKNKDKIKVYNDKYIKENLDHIRQIKKEHRKNNRNKILEKEKESRIKNRERRNAYAREYNIRNRRLVLDHYGHKCQWIGCGIKDFEFLALDHIDNNGRGHRKDIGDGSRFVRWLIKKSFPKDIVQILCHNHNTLKYKKLKNITIDLDNLSKHYKIKIRVFEKYGMVCTCCGESDVNLLTIDHVMGDGVKHRKNNKLVSGTDFYLWLIENNFPSNFRTLCYNCNMSLGFYGYCPHKKESLV